MAGDTQTIMRPKISSQANTAVTLQKSRFPLPKRSEASSFQKGKYTKVRCVPKKDAERKRRARGSAGDRLYDDGLKTPKALTRACCAADLDNSIRIGPDVIVNYVECTPLLLWCKKEKTSMVDFSKLVEKDSMEIVPMSPRASTAYDAELFQASRGRTPPMSWSANLTALEEDEFKAEGPFVDNVKVAHYIPLDSEEDNNLNIKKVQIQQKDGKFITKERVRVILTEPETIFLLLQSSSIVPALDKEKYAETEARNMRYEQLRETILMSESYVERSSQTYRERERDKSTQAHGIGVTDAESYCNQYVMVDEFNHVREMETLKRIKDEEDALMKAIADSAREEFHEEKQQSSESEDSDAEDDDQKIQSTVDWVRLEEEEDEEEVEPPNDISDEEFESDTDEGECADGEYDIEMGLDDLYRMREERKTTIPPKVLPNIKSQVMLLDRIINVNSGEAACPTPPPLPTPCPSKFMDLASCNWHAIKNA